MSLLTPDRKISNRLYVAVWAVLLESCLGVFFAGTVFSAALTAPSGKYALDVSQAQWIFASGIVLFAAGVVLSGILLGKIGPRKLALAGGGLLGGGYLLAGIFGTGLPVILICIGILGGLGAGLGYIVPVMIGMKWYPDKKGFITGLVLSGGVFGSIIWAGMAGSWFDLIDTLSLFGLDGLRSVFLLYGIASLAIILPAASAMSDPPWGYAQAGWSGSQQNGVPGSGLIHFEPKEMIRTPQFIMISIAFFLSVAAGLLAAGDIALFGLDALKARGLDPRISVAVAGWAAASVVFLNGVGHAVWGSISDMIGRRMSITILCLIQGIVLLLLYRVGGDPKALIFCACVIGFNLGGNFVLFPTVTAEYFGTKNFILNYGLIFIAAGVAGLIGPFLAGHFRDLAADVAPPGALQNTVMPLPGVWLLAFVTAGASSLAAALLAFFAKPPRKEISRFEAIMRFKSNLNTGMDVNAGPEFPDRNPEPGETAAQD